MAARTPLGKAILSNLETLVKQRNGEKSWDNAVEWMRKNYPALTKGKSDVFIREAIGRLNAKAPAQGRGTETQYVFTAKDILAIAEFARKGITITTI